MDAMIQDENEHPVIKAVERLAARKGEDALVATARSLESRLEQETLSPDQRVQAVLMLGRIYQKTGDIDKARNFYEKFLDENKVDNDDVRLVRKELSGLDRAEEKPLPLHRSKQKKKMKKHPGLHPGKLYGMEHENKWKILGVEALLVLVAIGLGGVVYWMVYSHYSSLQVDIKPVESEKVLHYQLGVMEPGWMRTISKTELKLGPSSTSRTLGVFGKDALVRVESGEEKGWVRVRTASGTQGYISRADLAGIGLRFDVFRDPYLAADLREIKDDINEIIPGSFAQLVGIDYSTKENIMRIYLRGWNLISQEDRREVLAVINEDVSRARKSSGQNFGPVLVLGTDGGILWKM